MANPQDSAFPGGPSVPPPASPLPAAALPPPPPPPEAFFCAQCSGEFPDHQILHYHRLADPDHEHCHRCDMEFESVDIHMLHLITSSKHIACPLCGEDFETEDGRAQHFRAIHPKILWEIVDKIRRQKKQDNEGILKEMDELAEMEVRRIEEETAKRSARFW